MLHFKQYLNESCDCWKGHKRVPGTKPCAPGSCVKVKEETVTEGERGLWDNIHAKRKRIKAGSGERMRKPGSKGAPTDAAIKASQNESLSPGWMLKADPKLAAALKAKQDLAKKRQASYGNPAAGKSVKEELSAEEQFDLIEELVMDLAEEHNIDPDAIWEKFESIADAELYEAAVDAKGHKSSTGGLTQKGRDAYNAKGANLKPPVTTPPSKLKPDSKAAKRRRSFCARMGGMEGPMKDDKGRPTRKALALRKWNC